MRHTFLCEVHLISFKKFMGLAMASYMTGGLRGVKVDMKEIWYILKDKNVQSTW